MNIQVSTLLTTKPRSNKTFRIFSYQRHTDSAWPYSFLFNLITTSHWPQSLLKYVGSSMKTGSPLGISSWENSFVKSILWIWKHRIHFKLNIYFTVAHWSTWKYEFRGSGDSLFWTFPLTQYRSFNFLIFQSGLLLRLKYHVSGSSLWSETDFLETISHVFLLIRIWISSYIAFLYYSKCSPDRTSIYLGVSGSWIWDLRT